MDVPLVPLGTIDPNPFPTSAHLRPIRVSRKVLSKILVPLPTPRSIEYAFYSVFGLTIRRLSMRSHYSQVPWSYGSVFECTDSYGYSFRTTQVEGDPRRYCPL